MAGHNEKLENILKLEPQARYDYFIRKVADLDKGDGFIFAKHLSEPG